jgi:hypothetical protein
MAPSVIDRFLARAGYESQQTSATTSSGLLRGERRTSALGQGFSSKPRTR